MIILWNFRQNTILPIVEVQTECDARVGTNFIIREAAAIIDEASKFNGIPFVKDPNFNAARQGKVVVLFSLMFHNKKEIEEFKKSLE